MICLWIFICLSCFACVQQLYIVCSSISVYLYTCKMCILAVILKKTTVWSKCNECSLCIRRTLPLLKDDLCTVRCEVVKAHQRAVFPHAWVESQHVRADCQVHCVSGSVYYCDNLRAVPAKPLHYIWIQLLQSQIVWFFEYQKCPVILNKMNSSYARKLIKLST